MFRAMMAATVILGAMLAATPASAATNLPAPNSHGLTLVGMTEVNDRLLDVVVSTEAIFQPVHVKIYLPAGYGTSARRYPTLYLMHGGGSVVDNAGSWLEEGDAADIVDQTGYSGIVVMPEAGKAGFFADWASPDNGGRRPRWETFHIGQLLPWIDENFRTLADRDDRTIAGISMGGFGALSYAARHPELFSAAGSFSGDLDIMRPSTMNVIGTFVSLVYGTAITNDQKSVSSYLARSPESIFGPYLTWPTRNPVNLVNVYRQRGIRIALYAGTGFDYTGFDFFESLAKTQADGMHLQLALSGVSNRYCSGEGAHVWPYWQGDFADFLHWVSGTPSATCPNNWGQPQ